MSRSSNPRRGKRRLLYFLLGLFGAYLAGCYVIADRYISPPRYDNPRDAIFTEETLDGAPIWTIAQPHPKAVFILCHGFQGRQAAWTEIARQLAKDGYAIIVPSFPGHDSHPDRETGFGLKERDIIGEVAAEARRRYPTRKVVVIGVSLGGAAAWLASEKFPTLIDAVITEGAFTRMSEASNRYFDRALPLGRFLLAPVRWITQFKSGINPDTINPIEAAAHWQKPALIMHGELDQIFPEAFAREFGRATGTTPWIIKGAGHAAGFESDPKGFIQHVEAVASKA